MSLLTSKFLLVIFLRKSIFYLYYDFTSHSLLLYMFVWGGIIQLGMRLLWHDFEGFLHCLCHHEMAVNDTVCLFCLCLIFSISFRISSAGRWEKSSSRSEPRGVLADMVMTSSGWYDTSIQSSLM